MKKKHFKQRARESYGLKCSLKTACAGGNSLNKFKITIIEIILIVILNHIFFHFIFYFFEGNAKLPIKNQIISDNYLTKNNRDELDSSTKSNLQDFDILKFWNEEIKRVNNVSLNLNYSDNLTYQCYNMTEIWFNSPNWVNNDTILRIHGYILFPKNITKNNPRLLYLHGYGGCANNSFPLSLSYLEKGFIVLAYDFPSHGKSDGGCREWGFEKGDYNKTSHCYLTLCSAIQGLRLLENLTLVDPTKIIVMGASYGGLNAMWLSGICGNRISGTIIEMASGDVGSWLEYSIKKLYINNLLSTLNVYEDPESYFENQNLRFDPIYYLKSKNIPPMMFKIGSSDKLFPHISINPTLDSISHDKKLIQIKPNEIHGRAWHDNTADFFIDQIINHDSNIPVINVFCQKNNGISNFTITVETSKNVNVSNIEVWYKDTNEKSSSWNILPVGEFINNNKWSGEFRWNITNKKVKENYQFIDEINVDFFATIYLESGEWFNSKIYDSKLFLNRDFNKEIINDIKEQIKKYEFSFKNEFILFFVIETFLFTTIVSIFKYRYEYIRAFNDNDKFL